jgi:hypothetical protein
MPETDFHNQEESRDLLHESFCLGRNPKSPVETELNWHGMRSVRIMRCFRMFKTIDKTQK